MGKTLNNNNKENGQNNKNKENKIKNVKNICKYDFQVNYFGKSAFNKY
ncbi:MAG: hypothetical protein J7L15_01270 [Clostridiales bacterium]|nr:hypothetical protein [Clostridiales bacterium]